MPWGALQAAVTVTNSTSTPGQAIVYGPALSLLRYVHPVLNPTQVLIQLSHGPAATYFGYVVPNVQPNHPAHVLMRFNPPRSGQPLNVTTSRTIQADDLHVLDNPDCTIGSRP